MQKPLPVVVNLAVVRVQHFLVAELHLPDVLAAGQSALEQH